MNTQATAKRLGLLHDMVPGGTRFGMLVNSSTVYEPDIAGAIAGAATFTGQIEVLTADTVREIDTAFASLVQKRVDALMVNSSVLFLDRRVQIVSLALRHAVPAIYFGREFADVGGLMSYGSNIADQVRQGGVYVGRVLKGDKPADLPVMLPTKLEFVVNLQAAKTLGLTVPPTLLAIADEVIE
jgi:putative ABC transport system substrate-binding protein